MNTNRALRILVCTASATAALSAQAISPTVVISQVYGGGGNSGATLRNDFIELFNRGDVAVSLNGWSVQYAASTGTSWQVTTLAGVLMPGGYYLIQQAAGTGGTEDLPVPDRTGTVAISATAGKVALVSDVTALAEACPTANVVDTVGFGSATNCAETTPTANLSNTTAAVRNGGGCVDTGVNSTDFTLGIPVPRNTGSATNSCALSADPAITTNSIPPATAGQPYAAQLQASGGAVPYTWEIIVNKPGWLSIDNTGRLSGMPPAPTSVTFTARVTDATGRSDAQDLTLTVNAGPAGCVISHTVEQIQGPGDISPLVPQKGARTSFNVTTTGAVTAVVFNGFFLQQIEWTGGTADNPAVSNGIFVFTSTRPDNALRGMNVCVTGPVLEYVADDPNSPPVTEIDRPVIVADLGAASAIPGPVMFSQSLPDPNGAYNQLERFEGMRVSVPGLNLVGATENTFGIFIGAISSMRPFRKDGIEQPEPVTEPTIPVWNGNPERIRVNSSAQTGAPALQLNAGQTVGALTGPLHFEDRTYTLMPDATFTDIPNAGSAAAVPPADLSKDLTFATMNLERFYNETGGTGDRLTGVARATKLAKTSMLVRNILGMPDVIAVEEVEDLPTLAEIAAKINADAGALSPGYTAYLVPGNDIINTGFLVRSTRVEVLDVIQEGLNTTYSLGGVDQGKLNDRPPLVLKARAARPGSANYLPFTAIAVHQRSLIGIDDPADGARVREKRAQQAEFLAQTIRDKYLADNLLVMGDFNGFEINDGYVDVTGTVEGAPVPPSLVLRDTADYLDPNLANLGVTFLAPMQRYSYVFRGNAQMIDHIMVNQNLLGRVSQFAIAHTNADFAEFLRNDATRPERVSDHDQPVAYVTLPANLVIGAAVIARVDGPGVDNRTYSLQLTNLGTTPITGCQLANITLSPAGAALTSQLPVIYGDLPAGSVAAQPVVVNSTPTVSRIGLTVAGSCQSAGATLPFSAFASTLR